MAQSRQAKVKAPKSASVVVDDSRDKFLGFANIDLADAHKEWVKANMDDLSVVDEHEKELIEAGFKLTASWDSNSDCFVFSGTGTPTIPDCNGIACSARSMDLQAAKLALYAKIAQVAEWNLTPYVKKNSRPLDV